MARETETLSGADLRQLREAWGWSQEKLAEALVITQAHVSWMELGERDVTPRTLKMLRMIAERHGKPWLDEIRSAAG